MDQIPAAMDRHLEVVECHPGDGGLLLGASSLTSRYWYGSLWYYRAPEVAPDVEKCTAGVQLEAGLSDACWVDNNRVLVAMDTGGIALWELTEDFHTFIQQSSATEHDDLVTSVCSCRKGSRVISASQDGSVKIWDLDTFSSTHTYRGHSGGVTSVHCHCSQPDLFLTASQDGYVCLWDTRKQKPVTRLGLAPLIGVPTCVAWQPGCDNTFAVGSERGQLVVRDTRAAVTEAASITPHQRNVTRIKFSTSRPNLLASVSEDCSVVVVDIREDKASQIYKDTRHGDFVRGVSWAGDKLYTCGWDAMVTSHTLPTSISDTSEESGHVKMEVNGELGEVETITKGNCKAVPEQCNGGGDNPRVNDEVVVEPIST